MVLANGCGTQQTDTQPIKKPENTEAEPEPSDAAQRAGSPFWQAACRQPDLGFMFDCNDGDPSYQIELTHEPFKDYVVLTLEHGSDSLITAVYYTRFDYVPTYSLDKYRATNKYKSINSLIVVNPTTKDKLYFFYEKPKKFQICQNAGQISRFFNESIWTMPLKGQFSPAIDPEGWHVRGRKRGMEQVWSRYSFLEDSAYYIGLQKVLDLAGVKDYKYERITN